MATTAQAQSFAASGDFGDTVNSTAVANLIKGQNPDYILALGDLCYGSSPSLQTQVGDKYGSYVTAGKYWPTLGNHEWTDKCSSPSSNNAANYFSYFTLPNGERYYRQLLGNVEVFSVAATCYHVPCTPSGAEYKYFQNAIQTSTAKWKVVIFHQAAYSSGDHGSTVNLQWPFEAWGADLVLNGHSHDYERIMKDVNGDGKLLPYVVSGLGGESFLPFGTPVAGSVVRFTGAFGASFFTATATTLTFQFKTVDGVVHDSFTLTKGAAAKQAAFNKTDADGSNSAQPLISDPAKSADAFTFRKVPGGK